MENLKYSEILQRNKALSGEVKGTPYKVLILSNVIVNSLKELVEYSLRTNQINPNVEMGNYDNIVQDSANTKNTDQVIIFYEALNITDSVSVFFEDLPDETYHNLQQKVFNEIDIIFNNLKDIPSVIFNKFSSVQFVSGYSQTSRLEKFVSELNNYLEEKKPLNVILIDISKIFPQIGLSQSIDYRLYNSSKAPYSLAFLKSYVSAIEPVFLRNTGKLKKAIIFDCDNTLWKGIIGEDGMDKIDMSSTSAYGKMYAAVQHIAVFLSKRGVIVGICSKNNEHDVNEVLLNHADMVLKNEYLVIKKINWEDKVTNLKAIAAELNIGLDSLVFVDDSSFEINMIKEQVPEIVTLQVPTQIFEYPNQLLKYAYKYFNLTAGKEDSKKTELYKQQFQRENTKSNYESLDDYLASLQIALTISKDDISSLQRTAQLTQKTNQFNLTTLRYTEIQVQQFIENKNDSVFTLSVTDKFGDSGLTAVCIVKQDAEEKNIAIIDTLLMSCRVIGRNIEVVFMDYILQWLGKNKYSSAKAEFIPTKKNMQVENFYDTLGFTATKKTGGLKDYFINLSDYKPKPIKYIKIEVKD